MVIWERGGGVVGAISKNRPSHHEFRSLIVSVNLILRAS